MLVKNFKLRIVLRVGFLVLSCFALVLAYLHIKDWVVNINLFALLVLQVAFLLRDLTKLDQKLSSFFEAVKYDDSGILLSSERGKDLFPLLHNELLSLNVLLNEQKTKKEQLVRYLQSITEHVQVGLISFNEEGSVKLMNKAACSILNCSPAGNISELNKLNVNFSQQLLKLKPAEKVLLKLQFSSSQTRQVLLQATEFKTRTESEKIVSIQDIQSELEHKEVETWQKMTRVLTHEIMNSIGPIHSTIESLKEISVEDGEEISKQELQEDLHFGLNIIEERTLGMANFAHQFKSLNSVPKPNKQAIDVEDLFKQLKLLKTKELENINCEFMIIGEGRILNADPQLLIQVLINLLNNAIDAVKKVDAPQISLSFQKQERDILSISDNGTGIPEELREEVFIPFYTTKRDGSGIGLSLAKQIMQKHGGSIELIPGKERGTSFRLSFEPS